MECWLARTGVLLSRARTVVKPLRRSPMDALADGADGFVLDRRPRVLRLRPLSDYARVAQEAISDYQELLRRAAAPCC